ncbi:hypothetical protein [Tumebacillus avium]|uniref:hypothetical protein n=1 Tax=Tumebacillus avium TaxID=1903704 RepID=UPI0012FD9C3A|nr:hypothetical protein [Tumebacillus avium]
MSDFDLDMPYMMNEQKVADIMKERNCSFNEATKLDYELNWKCKRHTFRLQTRCITAMFERLFGKMKTEDCWKIIVECVDSPIEDGLVNISGVLHVRNHFDYTSFIPLSESEKKKKALELLMNGVYKICEQKGWDSDLFDRVNKLIQELDYTNQWVWKKPLKSPDSSYFAEVLCEHDLQSMEISLLIKEKSGREIIRKKVIEELPDEFAYAKHLGKLKWLSTDEVALVNKKGDRMWAVKVTFE